MSVEHQSLLPLRAINDDESLHLFQSIAWQRRDVILFLVESIGWAIFSITWAFLFVLPLCGLIFHCECLWLWEECTSNNQTCPFCGSASFGLSTSLIPQWGVVPLMVAAALFMRFKKPNMYVIRCVVVIVTFFVFIILSSLIYELASGYPHFM